MLLLHTPLSSRSKRAGRCLRHDGVAIQRGHPRCARGLRRHGERMREAACRPWPFHRRSGSDAMSSSRVASAALRAAFAGGLWQMLGDRRPTFVIVEPGSADCLFQTATHGEMRSASGNLATTMGMLSCGVPRAWRGRFSESAAEFFMTIEDSRCRGGRSGLRAGACDAWRSDDTEWCSRTWGSDSCRVVVGRARAHRYGRIVRGTRRLQ